VPPRPPRCLTKQTWSADCGFVDPGEDFEFQAKQRDALLERMSMARNNPAAVEAFQYYIRWMLERTAEVSNLWAFNMAQNPELDPSASAPVSAFGLRLMSNARADNERELFEMLRQEGAFFVYFSRFDCAFCHQMTEPLRLLQATTGLPVRNAALDERCMPGLLDGCMTAPSTHPPAQALQVATVPALFLFTSPNTWLRIANGVADAESMRHRTVQFFTAYRTALLRGVSNSTGGRPSVDFSRNEITGLGAGVPGAAGGQTPVRLPSEAEVRQMLGARGGQ
jgi:conjugal transfer pilus assembly protein TraF